MKFLCNNYIAFMEFLQREKSEYNSTKILDVIKVYGAYNTIYARKGNDTITVYKGSGHHIYGGDSNDKFLI